MQQALSKKFVILALSAVGTFFANFVSAQVCPVCVVAIGAGLGLSRWIGIDDAVSSVWIGAFMFAITSWTVSYIRKKGWGFHDDGIVVTLIYVALTYIPLYYAGIVGHPQNTILGMDKIIFGSIIGATVLFLGHLLYLYLKKLNHNKVYFPYQRVVVPVVLLVITSLIIWITIR